MLLMIISLVSLHTHIHFIFIYHGDSAKIALRTDRFVHSINDAYRKIIYDVKKLFKI